MRSGGRKNPMLDDGAGEGNGDGDRGTVKCREPKVWNDDGIMRLQGRKGMDPKGLPPFTRDADSLVAMRRDEATDS